MNDLARLKAWMTSNNLTVSQLASEIGIPYITAYMCIEKRQLLSAYFERRFRQKFGSKVADQIFVVTTPEPVLEPA